MSFLTERTLQRGAVAIIPRIFAGPIAPRSFSTSLALRKTPVESVKDGLKTVDRKVSDKLVDGINVAADAGTKAKSAAANMTSGDVAAKAQEAKGEVLGKAQEAKGKAAGKAEELKGSAKATAEEVKSKI